MLARTITRRVLQVGAARNRQQGVAALLTAVFLMAAVLCLVLVVDTGRLYYEKRSLQRIADMSAIDAATRGGACGGATGGDITALAQASAARNGYGGNLASSPNSVTPGTISVAGGNRVFTAGDAASSDAVQVIATNAVPASLIAGGLIGSTVTLSARAVAQRQVLGGISISSGLLALNTGSSPLLAPIVNGLLGSNINASVLSSNGVANANVNVLSFLQVLQTQLNVGTVQDVLTSNVSLLDIVRATGDVLNTSGNPSVTTIGSSLLATPVSLSGATVNVATLLGLQAGSDATNSALNTSINAFNLLMAAGSLANGNSAINLNVGVPGITQAKLSVIQPPQVAFGPPGINPATNQPYTMAQTGQLTLDLIVSPNIGLASVDLDVQVQLANGRAYLDSVTCSTLGNPKASVVVKADSSIDMIRIGSASNINNPATISVLGVSLPLALNGYAPTAIVGQSSAPSSTGLPTTPLDYTVTYSHASNGMDTQTITPSSQSVDSSLNISIPQSFTLPLGLGAVVQGIVNPILNTVLDPLLKTLVQGMLGVQLGYANVQLVSLTEGTVQLVN